MNTKRLTIEDLPEGAYSRYMRDALDGSFNKFKEDFEKNRQEELAIRDKEHPIEYNYKFQLSTYESVWIFKRAGEEWTCSECDMSPAGGSGTISLKGALEKIQKCLEDKCKPQSFIFAERELKA
jgi:hypothetical protein